MSNHVHILIDTSIQLSEISDDIELEMKYVSLDKIMKKIKGPTAMYCNKLLHRSGQFWERESFDIYIRNEKMFNNVISYDPSESRKSGHCKTLGRIPWQLREILMELQTCLQPKLHVPNKFAAPLNS